MKHCLKLSYIDNFKSNFVRFVLSLLSFFSERLCMAQQYSMHSVSKSRGFLLVFFFFPTLLFPA